LYTQFRLSIFMTVYLIKKFTMAVPLYITFYNCHSFLTAVFGENTYEKHEPSYPLPDGVCFDS
jgi:hypothetical protein